MFTCKSADMIGMRLSRMVGLAAPVVMCLLLGPGTSISQAAVPTGELSADQAITEINTAIPGLLSWTSAPAIPYRPG